MLSFQSRTINLTPKINLIIFLHWKGKSAVLQCPIDTQKRLWVAGIDQLLWSSIITRLFKKNHAIFKCSEWKSDAIDFSALFLEQASCCIKQAQILPIRCKTFLRSFVGYKRKQLKCLLKFHVIVWNKLKIIIKNCILGIQ